MIHSQDNYNYITYRLKKTSFKIIITSVSPFIIEVFQEAHSSCSLSRVDGHKSSQGLQGKFMLIPPAIIPWEMKRICEMAALIIAEFMSGKTRNKYDDVIKWKHFPCYWSFVRRIHRWPMNSPYKSQWRGALMFSFICAWTGDLRRHRAHYEVIAMISGSWNHEYILSVWYRLNEVEMCESWHANLYFYVFIYIIKKHIFGVSTLKVSHNSDVCCKLPASKSLRGLQMCRGIM